MIETLFPTFVYRERLAGSTRLNADLKKELAALEKIDVQGRAWSRKNYRGGYSSYSSLTNLHMTSPNFGELERKLRSHVQRFVRKLNWNLMGRKITMTTCWANSMGQGSYHGLHLHPSSVISGVYYVDVPKNSSPLKFEDPRLGLQMASPPRKASAPAREQNYVLYPAKAGQFLLFESWLRHEVPPHPGREPRLSISFNYEWS